MNEKSASVHWEGRGKEGRGSISTETGALKDFPYGFASRFENDRRGTNPEEILGAAHAACFAMAFSFACDKAGFATTRVDTRAGVRLVKQGDGFLIDRIALVLEGDGSGIGRSQVSGDCECRKTRLPALQGARERAGNHVEGSLTLGRARDPFRSGTTPSLRGRTIPRA
jgi:osmotically inducible protein OsmC